MVRFIQVSADEVPNEREGRRGRVSYPIIKSFMETGFYIAEVDMTGVQQKPELLNLLLRSYAKNHQTPIKVFMRNKKLYIMRLDIDENGNQIPNWEEGLIPDSLIQTHDPQEITGDEVDRRYEREKGQTTK